MERLRPILLAEDNRDDVELTLTAFAKDGLANRVAVVGDGVEALEYLRYQGKYVDREYQSPALLLLDIKMPRMDGLELLRVIRSDPKLHAIPVVMLTSSRHEQDLISSYDLGVNAYVVKPVRFDDFTKAVRQVGAFWAVLNELPPQGQEPRDEE